jgi:hypothetical protein
MAYRKVTTFTRPADSTAEWPFWATELQGTDYDTESTAWLNWMSDRSDVTMTSDFASDPTQVVVTLSFADEAAYIAWNTAREDAGHTGDYLANTEVTNYLTANSITVAHTTESD